MPREVYVYSNTDLEEVTVGSAVLTPIAMNRTVGVLNSVHVLERCRGKGYGKQLVLKAEAQAKLDEMKILLATVLEDNAPMLALLYRCGWIKLAVFQSTASRKMCGLWIKQL